MPIKKEETHDVKIVLVFNPTTCTLEEMVEFTIAAKSNGFGLDTVVTYQSNIPGLTISRSVLEKDN